MDKYKDMIELLRKTAEVKRLLEQEGTYELLMQSADAIEELMESSANFEELWHQAMEMRNNDLDKVAELINALKALQSVGTRWIPIGECLPITSLGEVTYADITDHAVFIHERNTNAD